MIKLVIAAIALVNYAYGQGELPQLPDCATKCLTRFTTGDGIGGCPQLDARCICSSKSFLDGIACCIADVCDEDDQKAAVKYAGLFCNTQGVDVPSAVSCATTISSAVISSSIPAHTTTESIESTSHNGGSSATATGATTSATANDGYNCVHGSGTGTGVFASLFITIVCLTS